MITGDFGLACLGILLHGLAYGMILFLISVGLSVTMGLMGFVNLAHGAFAMLGGYAMVVAMFRFGFPYGLAVLTAAVVVALISVPLERGLYGRLYGKSELQQVLMTIGLIMVLSSAARYIWGPLPQPMQLPTYLSGSLTFGAFAFPFYRLAMIVAGVAVALVLWLTLDRTMIGARIRASVDNRPMAESVGIDTRLVFTCTFALGSGLGAMGGALGADLLAISPDYAQEYLVSFLIVVAIGGLGTIKGPFVAAMLLGVISNASQYFFPQIGALVIYLTAFCVLLFRPEGLFGQAEVVK